MKKDQCQWKVNDEQWAINDEQWTRINPMINKNEWWTINKDINDQCRWTMNDEQWKSINDK